MGSSHSSCPATDPDGESDNHKMDKVEPSNGTEKIKESTDVNHDPTKLGHKWSGLIYFDAEADSENGNDYHIEPHNLWDKLSCLIDVEDEIQEVSVHSNKLYSWQLSHWLLHHAFVLVKSGSCYWSIEKNDEGLTIQRSRKIEFVHSKYRRQARKVPITKKNIGAAAGGNRKMKHLIRLLQDGDELNNVYCWYTPTSNCQGFAQRVFESLSGVRK